MVHAYAVLASAAPQPAGLQGIDGRPVELLTCGPLAAAVSEHPGPPQPTAGRLQAHRRVNLALLGAPFRFGAGAADRRALQTAVAARCEMLLALVEAVAGCIEYTVSFPAAPPSSPPAGSQTGTAYLLRKKRLLAEADARRESLQHVARAIREQPAGDGLHFACLVPAAGQAQFRALAAGWNISGPWPPTSFV